MQDSTFQDQVLQRVDLVAEQFQEIAPQAWEILVRQQVIEGIMGVAFGVVTLAVFAYCFKQGSEVVDPDSSYRPRRWDREEVWGIASVATAILAFFGLIALCVSIPYLLNPEYYALMDLMP